MRFWFIKYQLHKESNYPVVKHTTVNLQSLVGTSASSLKRIGGLVLSASPGIKACKTNSPECSSYYYWGEHALAARLAGLYMLYMLIPCSDQRFMS